MKKIIYIIPGWTEKCSLKPYKKLIKVVTEKGYEVNCKDVDWKKPLSAQIFEIPKEAVVFGFSLGALLGRMVAQKYPCNHLLLASSTIVDSLKEGVDRKAYIDLLGEEFVNDIIKNITEENLSKKQTTFYGELEGEDADIIVPKTDHELSDKYIEMVGELL